MKSHCQPNRALLSVLGAILILAGAAPLAAQTEDGKGTDQAKTPARSELNLFGSPRQTMQTFLEGTPEQQIQCLDLSAQGLTEDTRQTQGAQLAYELREAIHRILDVALIAITHDPKEPMPYCLADQSHRIDGDIIGEQRELAEKDLKQIVIEPQDDGLWRFSQATVQAIPEIASHWQEQPKVVDEDKEATEPQAKPFSIWLRDLFPSTLQGRPRLDANAFYVAPYQWICMAVVVALGFLADLIVRFALNLATEIWVRFNPSDDPKVRKRVWRPIGLLMQGVVWYYGIKWIALPPILLDSLVIGLKAFTIVAAVWTAFRLIELIAYLAARRAAATASRFDDIIVPMVARSLKFIAVCIGILTFAQVFDLPVFGIVGGLGIGGMALAFAAQDAVSNFFGSVTVLFDRPFEVGDWIVTDGVEGTVETVGFRSTRVRTFHNSLITLPNSKLTTASVDNMGRRQYRRFSTKLGVTYDTTPEQIEAFCEGIRELLRQHPYTRKDYFEVHVNEFTDSSLNMLLYCFFECSDWSIELRERHRLILDILRLAKELHVEFAFPTRTLHMHSCPEDTSLPPDVTAVDGRKAAERIVGGTVSRG